MTTTTYGRLLVTTAAAALLVTTAGCGSSQEGVEDGAPAVEATSTPAPATVEPAPAVTGTAQPMTEPAVAEWTMPDLTGMNLQDAQDRLQRETGYGVPLSTSTDATGAGRQQVLDRNWVVCEQDPPAGATIRTGDVPNLVVVKRDESCG